MQPVGPEAAAVYWRRRAVLGGSLLLVLVLVLAMCGGGGGGEQDTDGSLASSSTEPSTAAELALGGGLEEALGASAPAGSAGTGQESGQEGQGQEGQEPGAGASEEPVDEPAGAPAPKPGGACSDDDIEVTAGTDAGSYGPGATPLLTITVTNTSKAACKRDVGAAALSLVVTSGKDRIWGSDDCGGKGSASVRKLAPGKPFSTSVNWSRKRSAPEECGAGRLLAKPGTYALTATAGSASSAPKRFLLR